VIHPDSDSIIPFAGGQRVFEAAPSAPKTFVALKNTDHNEMYANRPEYWSAVDRFLAGAPPQRP
jgi:fermentation-respiration switch protein FrsA (DUF1100 family)